jgi:hypothetical protein
MFRDPDVVIEQTVENLKLLAEFFSAEIETHDHQQTPALHRFRDARSTTVALIQKLAAVQQIQKPAYQNGRPYCWNCD